MISNEVNNKMYNIDNFYVGELLFIKKISDENFANVLEIKKQLLANGAINLTNDDSNYADLFDWNQNVKYYKVITIFYKEKDNFLCLHDGNIYKNCEETKCLNLTELTKMLPKVSYDYPQKVTIDQVLMMFNKLFNKSYKLIDIYKDTKYQITDFYVGNLIILIKFTDKETKQKQYYNIYEKYILEKNSHLIGYLSNSNKVNDLVNLPVGRYKYNVYRCLVLKLSDNSLYNINNFQIYKNQDRPYNLISERPVGESYYENLTPITDVLKIPKTTRLSIPKVLTKQILI